MRDVGLEVPTQVSCTHGQRMIMVSRQWCEGATLTTTSFKASGCGSSCAIVRLSIPWPRLMSHGVLELRFAPWGLVAFDGRMFLSSLEYFLPFLTGTPSLGLRHRSVASIPDLPHFMECSDMLC